MKEIKLTQGKVALVDDEDFERLNKHKWCALRRKTKARVYWYAVYSINKSSKQEKCSQVQMHAEIMGTRGTGLYPDHINHDGLDNRKENLRLATASQNIANSRKQPGTSSKYKGVNSRPKAYRYKRWLARITINGKRHYLGTYCTEEEAGKAYADAARKAQGEFACFT